MCLGLLGGYRSINQNHKDRVQKNKELLGISMAVRGWIDVALLEVFRP